MDEWALQDDLGGGKGPPDAPKILVPHKVVYKFKITFSPIGICTKSTLEIPIETNFKLKLEHPRVQSDQ